MTTDTQHSARRVTELVRRAHALVEAGAEPASRDPWVGISLAAMVVQAAALEGLSDDTAARPIVPEYCTVEECLRAVQRELEIWDWDGLSRDDLRAGCRLVLDVAQLVRAL